MLRWTGLRVFEAWMVSRLLSSPSFHKVIRKVHRRVQEVKRGEKLYDPEEFSGLQIDKPNGFKIQKFLNHFKEELKDQFRGLTKK